MISANDVKAAINPEQFCQSRLPDLKSGSGWVEGGLCPFHADKKAGSFRVNLDNGAFKCFSCGAHGSDVIAFAQQQDSTDFSTTIKALAAEYGVEGVKATPEQRQAFKEHDAYRKLQEREEVLQHELHVLLQVISLRVSSRKNETNLAFRESRPEWRPMAPDHWGREVEAAANVVKLLFALYPEVS